MGKILRFTPLLLIFILGLYLSGQVGAKDPDPFKKVEDHGQIEGVVLCEGTPVPDARVYIGGTYFYGVTNYDGEFTIYYPPVGGWELFLEKDGNKEGPVPVQVIKSKITNVGNLSFCSTGVCGDGNQDPGEECDDGNTDDGDGCSGTCQNEGSCEPSPEVCDGIDNDCNGQVDDIAPRACGSDEGECSQGIQSCIDGQWGACEGSVGPEPEVCDGLDNNCDGQVDEDGVCSICSPPDCDDGNECTIDSCNQGSCENTFASQGTQCTGGICDDQGNCVPLVACPSGLTECNGACVDTSSDSNHCGGCNAACGTGEICDNGSCI